MNTGDFVAICDIFPGMPSRTVRDIPVEALKLYHPFRIASEPPPLRGRLEAAKDIAVVLARVMKEQFSASKVVLFGSVLRSDFSQWSDIDIAVWGIPSSDIYKAAAFVSGYSKTFKIDLVDAEDCSPSLLQHIEQHGVEL